MKIDIIYDSELDDQICYRISVEDEKDYDMLSYLILKGDVIKKKNKDGLIFVNNIEFNSNCIIIYGYETNYYPENFDGFDENQKKKFYIDGICQFELYRYKYFEGVCGFMEDQIKLYNEEKEKRRLVSDRDIQDKCFQILNNYISNKVDLVVYGSKALQLLEDGSLKVILITYDILRKQDDKYKENHKYGETNIVVYNEDSNNYDELMNYGGIIGVLQE